MCVCGGRGSSWCTAPAGPTRFPPVLRECPKGVKERSLWMKTEWLINRVAGMNSFMPPCKNPSCRPCSEVPYDNTCFNIFKTPQDHSYGYADFEYDDGLVKRCVTFLKTKKLMFQNPSISPCCSDFLGVISCRCLQNTPWRSWTHRHWSGLRVDNVESR